MPDPEFPEVPMEHIGHHPECLGEIRTEDLFARITNYNPHANSMEKILAAVPQGFCVNAVFEFDRLGTEFLPRFVRIELTPKRE
jgi:hypothetical protein